MDLNPSAPSAPTKTSSTGGGARTRGRSAVPAQPAPVPADAPSAKAFTTTSTDPARAVMEALAGHFPPAMLCAKMEALLNYQRTYMNRHGEMISTPDGSVQLKALDTIIAYTVGRPLERQFVVSAAPTKGMGELLDHARKSPVFRQTLRQLLKSLPTDPDIGENSYASTTPAA